MSRFHIGRYTYSAMPKYYYLYSNGQSSYENDIVKSYDRRLHQSLDKIFRKRFSSSSSTRQFKKFRPDPQHSTDWKSKIRPILDQEAALSKHFSREEFEKLSLLWISVLAGYEKSAELLVRFGADVNELFGRHNPQVIDEKSTILHLLIQMSPSPKNERFIRLVVDHGADLHARDYKGRTVLHYAIEKGRFQITEMLLEKGADVNLADNLGETPLLMVVTVVYLPIPVVTVVLLPMPMAITDSRMDKELVLLLIKHGADLEVRDSLGRTVLHRAVIEGRVQTTEMLLEKGADVNAADNEGWQPLLVALRNTVSTANELVPLLIKHGADVFAKSRNGENILHLLVLLDPQEHAAELARVMIERGVSLDDKTSFLHQPIHRAAIHGKNKLLELFLDHGANVNALTREGESPLYLAALSRNEEVVEILIKRGANVNLKMNEGRTALHIICISASIRSTDKKRSIIRLLVSAGADVLAEDCDGNTPLALILSENVDSPEIWLLIKALALKKALQPSIELKDKRIIERYPWMRNYYDDCFKELDKMKIERFIHTCTFFDLFSKSYYQIAGLMRNPKFETEFKQYDLSGFPTYAEDMLPAVERAQNHYQLMLKQADVINKAFYDILPYLVVDKVVHYIFNCCKSLK